ncbi:centrosome-associated protein CEP250-like [Watersipora subatra]|uniref:centrosome-associated protein CEP250-like n=1 Tax=Watersipora subatra TaxID=2589382 RepID=UPI00355B8EAD
MAPKLTIDGLEGRAPKSLKHARSILSSALVLAQKKLSAIEKNFYGSKHAKVELGKKARLITKVMKQVNLSWLTEPIHLDRLAARAIFSDDDDGLTLVIKQIRDFYDKTWKAVPADLQPVIDRIQLVLRYLRLYCPPLYNPSTDPHIQTAKDYELKYKTMTADIKKYLDHVCQLYEKFQKGQMYMDEMSQGTRELAMKLEAEDCPFVFAFHEACECLREAMRCEEDWLVVSNEYKFFLESEANDLQDTKSSLQQKVRRKQDEYNKQHYRLTTLGTELDNQKSEQAVLQSKEMELIVRQESLLARVAEFRLDFDIKEFRLAEVKRTTNPKTATLSELDTLNKLVEEVKLEGRILQDIHKELNLIKLKLTQLTEKQQHYQKLTLNYEQLNRHVKLLDRSYLSTSKELHQNTHTIEHIKYMVQYLDTPDTAQQIFLELPRRREALGMSRSHGLNLQSTPDDVLDKVFDLLSQTLGLKWVQMYRDLPFYPERGSRTIEEDIVRIQSECVRDSINKEIRKSLDRWRRFHTRAKASDLLPVLRKMGEYDILAALETVVHPPRAKTPVVERFPTFLEASLVPYYQQVSRYDHLRHSKKASQTPALPPIAKSSVPRVRA